MAWEARWGLKLPDMPAQVGIDVGLNGLGSPLGIETRYIAIEEGASWPAKWPGKPVGD